jgi:3-oxo-5-alpha-steroid 4-dehydrogenase 1
VVPVGRGDHVTERALLDAAVWGVLALSPVTWIALTRITAPYGRHVRRGWGPHVSSKLGWVLMEAPSAIGFAAIFLLGDKRGSAAALLLAALWLAHYVNRAFVFPFRRRASNRPTPIVIVGMGATFNCVNIYINARWLSHFGSYTMAWFSDPRLWIGSILFVVGFAINLHSDQVLMKLRAPGQSGYSVPHGGLYRLVSCPNYLGEIIEWAGWAIAAWSLPGLAFALYTACNLVPRAVAHHRWYRSSFADYPAERRAILPLLY